MIYDAHIQSLLLGMIIRIDGSCSCRINVSIISISVNLNPIQIINVLIFANPSSIHLLFVSDKLTLI